MNFRVYSAAMLAPNGKLYSVRYLLDEAELAGLRSAGLVPENTCEVIDMQDAADIIAADFEMQTQIAGGGRLQ